MEPLTVIGIIALLVLIVILGKYNGLVRTKKKVEQERATIDVYLTQRFDLIPNLVEVTKGYAKHESETLIKVVNERNKVQNMSSLAKEEDKISSSVKSLFAVAENYPDLKASHNFLALQEELLMIENELLAARRTYNAAVTEYNTTIQSFPTNILAKMMKKMPKKLFVVNDDVRNTINLKI